MLLAMLYNVGPSTIGWALIVLAAAIAIYCVATHAHTGRYPTFMYDSEQAIRVIVTTAGSTIVGFYVIGCDANGAYGKDTPTLLLVTAGAFLLTCVAILIEALRSTHATRFVRCMYALISCMAAGAVASVGSMRFLTNQWALAIPACWFVAVSVALYYVVTTVRSRPHSLRR